MDNEKSYITITFQVDRNGTTQYNQNNQQLMTWSQEQKDLLV